MSLNHLVEGGLADVDLDVKSLSIQGSPVTSKTLSLDEVSYLALDLTGVSTVFLSNGPSTVIAGLAGSFFDGQTVTFGTCQQASSITIQSFGLIRTSTGSDIVLTGVGESAVGIWSDALGYMTISKTS